MYLASMMSDYFVKELLAFSADPAGTIHEGLTPLRLAARGQESNVVGLLISFFTKTQDTEKQVANGTQHLNAKDQTGCSPLHYACRAGRYRFHDKLFPWVLPGKAAIATSQKIYHGPWTEPSTGIRSPHDTTQLEKRFSKMLFESALKREKGTKITA